MSALGLVFRIAMATVIVLVLGVMAVMSFTVIEPFFNAFGGPPASLGWGSLGLHTVSFAAAGFVALFLVLIVWLVYAPIREDQRQQFRR